MSIELLAALAVLTYGSRAAALAFLPPLPERLVTVVDRMPPALFAGLAAQSLIDASGALAAAPVLAAAAAALIVAPRRSLPICLVAGLIGYGVLVLIG
jgi:hypothetical protein